eukprot:scaffold70365_cov29-Tisochrysis_lutea.AAC.2
MKIGRQPRGAPLARPPLSQNVVYCVSLSGQSRPHQIFHLSGRMAEDEEIREELRLCLRAQRRVYHTLAG